VLLEDFLWDLIGIMVGYGWVKYGIYSGQTPKTQKFSGKVEQVFGLTRPLDSPRCQRTSMIYNEEL